uniref:Uncharacterized protein n=1 Tax=Serinus canaria TaxID=9135 RepID=A0A8C9MYY0_SERCA
MAAETPPHCLPGFHPEHKSWDAEKDAKEPDEQADPFGHGFAPHLSAVQGVDKSEVAIHADGHEQVDAGVHVQGDGGADAAAQETAKGPVELIADVLCPEGEAHEEDKVSNSQVHKVDFGFLQGALVQRISEENKHISKHTNNADSVDVLGPYIVHNVPPVIQVWANS